MSITLPYANLFSYFFHCTDRVASKFAIKSILNIPPHLTNVATLPCEYQSSKNCRAAGQSEANCGVKTQPLKNIVEKYLPSDVTIISFTGKKIFSAATLKIA